MTKEQMVASLWTVGCTLGCAVMARWYNLESDKKANGIPRLPFMGGLVLMAAAILNWLSLGGNLFGFSFCLVVSILVLFAAVFAD